jgi:hypothetical protein
MMFPSSKNQFTLKEAKSSKLKSGSAESTAKVLGRCCGGRFLDWGFVDVPVPANGTQLGIMPSAASASPGWGRFLEVVNLQNRPLFWSMLA